MGLIDRIRKTKMSVRREPLWKGPQVDGVTNSLLSKFIVCRERFRVLTIDGLKPAKKYSHRVEYGNMWHVCEEELASENQRKDSWKVKLDDYVHDLSLTYPSNREDIRHWYLVCLTQFPYYVRYYEKTEHNVSRKPVYKEKVFDVPLHLPSGRIVRLRGKWDSVDQIGQKLYIQENKTKGDVSVLDLEKQLTFDLQSMFYVAALRQENNCLNATGNVGGVRYNVVRRPLSGGKGTIRRHATTKSNPKGESEEEFYNRLAGLIDEEPSYYFKRWLIDVKLEHVQTFLKTCLYGLLENLCDWYELIGLNVVPARRMDSIASGLHWRMPYGVYSPLLEGGDTDLDDYINTGNRIGLREVTTLFEELEG